MSYCYRSTGLTYVGIVARVTFKLVYSTGVGIFRFLCELLVYCVGGTEGYCQIGSFEKIGDLMCGRAVICEGDPFPIIILLCLCEGGAAFLAINLYLRLWIKCTGNPLLWVIMIIFFHSWWNKIIMICLDRKRSTIHHSGCSISHTYLLY